MVDFHPVSAKKKSSSNTWFFYALGSAVFASLTAILSKVGIEHVDASVGTAIRTCVVLIMAWAMVFLEKSQSSIKHIPKKSWLFLILSGFSTGLSWLCYNTALQTGPASVVVPIDKLSIVFAVVFARVVYKETLSKKRFAGLFLLIGGTLLLLV